MSCNTITYYIIYKYIHWPCHFRCNSVFRIYTRGDIDIDIIIRIYRTPWARVVGTGGCTSYKITIPLKLAVCRGGLDERQTPLSFKIISLAAVTTEAAAVGRELLISCTRVLLRLI